MEAIVIILILVLLSASSKKKKKAQKANAKPTFAQQLADAAQQLDRAAKEVSSAAQTTSARRAAAKPATPQVKAAVQPVTRTNMQPAQGESLLDDPDCLGGSMAHDHAEGGSILADGDCYGGSMEHDHAEGVDRADQARRMAAMDAERERRRKMFVHADRGPAVSAGDLRRAVVMAEILDRPKALRPRRL